MAPKQHHCADCHKDFETPEQLNAHRRNTHAPPGDDRADARERGKDAAARPESSGDNRGGIKRSNQPF